jgi:hypothetical protein
MALGTEHLSGCIANKRASFDHTKDNLGSAARSEAEWYAIDLLSFSSVCSSDTLKISEELAFLPTVRICGSLQPR